MEVKILGTGCASCNNTYNLIGEVAKSKGVEVTLSKIENIQDIMRYNVMSLPAVVIDGKVVHAGGMPTRDKIESWF